MVQQSTVIRPEGNVITVRKYEMKDDQLHLRKISSSQSHKIISSTGGCLFSREKAVKDVNSRVRFCFLVGVYLDLDWSRKI